MSNNPLTLTNDEVLLCPFAAYKTLRDEHPVYKDPVSGMFIVSRYDDIRAVAGNPRLFSNQTGSLSDVAFKRDDEAARIMKSQACPHVDTLVTADPPAHTRYRSLVDKAFSVVRIRKMEDYIERVARERVAAFEANGRAEFVSEMAVPMPVYIIADQLGVPRDRYAEFKRWSDAKLMISDVRLPDDVRADSARAIVEMHRFLVAQTEAYRHTPADNIFSDIANGQVDGRPLDVNEVVSIISQLLVAGNETTTNTMAMGLHLMITEGHEAALRAEPAKIAVFVEEVLRLTTSLQGLFRRATADTELHGIRIPKDAILMLRWAAGNRDERRFEQPERLDLERKDAQRHMTFGYGAHFCIGNQLARAELRIGFKVLLERLRGIRLANEPEAVRWIVHAFARGLSQLKIEFDKA